MPDELFAHPRLAALYDVFDGDRSDLPHYVAIAEELGAQSVLDVGCGTGSLSCLLAARGFEVAGVDPARASLDIARAKPGGNDVRWIDGDATTLPPLQVDLAVMTGNVAQVFTDDADWRATLTGIAAAVRRGGHFVFETRDPQRRAWEEWTPELTRQVADVAGVGTVESWGEVTNVNLPFVSFRFIYNFGADGTTLTSDSTLVFRSRDEIEASLVATGWAVQDIRQAPDRPGKEFVFVATRPA